MGEKLFAHRAPRAVQAHGRVADADAEGLVVEIGALQQAPVVVLQLPEDAEAARARRDLFGHPLARRFADFDRSRDGLPWAFGIASYEIMTHRRRLQLRREVFDEATVMAQLDISASQEERLLALEQAVALAEALGSLTEADRASLGLDDGGSGATGATLRRRKQRALDRLLEIWQI